MQRGIVPSKNQKDILVKHAKRNVPNESCAILFGNIENYNFTVKDVFLTKNIEDSPVNFAISNDELIRGYAEAEKKKLDVVGIFHSHPNSSARPSLTDKKLMEINPVPWIIFSNENEEMKAYLYESKIIEINLSVV